MRGRSQGSLKEHKGLCQCARKISVKDACQMFKAKHKMVSRAAFLRQNLLSSLAF